MYETKILLDSVGPAGVRLTTWQLTYPRFVHTELMTHRVFSRNSASSRAIPVKTMLERIENDPAGPVFWGKNQKGMQAVEEFSENERELLERKWRSFSLQMIAASREFEQIGVHKQITNRLTEPWMFITVIVSATSFTNWFRLRHHKDAQPEIKKVATDMLPLYKASKPQVLQAGEWHLPLVTGVDYAQLLAEGFTREEIKAISAGRVARVSYLTHEGVRDPRKDIELGMRLGTQNPPHMSPLEHVAQALTLEDWNSHVRTMVNLAINEGVPFNPMTLGNFTGWYQFRKQFENEHGFDFNLEELP